MTWILFLLLVILLILAIVWWLTFKALFNPDKEMHTYPHHHYEDIYLPIEGDPHRCYSEYDKPKKPCLNMWYFNQNHQDYCDRYSNTIPSNTLPSPNHSDTFSDTSSNSHSNTIHPRRTVLFFHGNSGNISHRDYVIDVCREFGLDLLLVDYRGYGNSDGIPEPRGIRKDAMLAYDFLKTKCDPQDIIVWGESLGGSAAAYVASQRRCRCLILISTFSSLEDCIFDCSMPKWFKYPVGYLVKWTVEPIPSKNWMYKTQCPVVVIHSEEDDLINFSNAQKLYDSVQHDCKMLVKIKGKHSCPVITERQLQAVFEFADIDTCRCSDEKMNELLDNIRTVAVRKGLSEDVGFNDYYIDPIP